MKVDLSSIIAAFDNRETMRLQEIVIEGKTIRFLTTAASSRFPPDKTDQWIRQNGES